MRLNLLVEPRLPLGSVRRVLACYLIAVLFVCGMSLTAFILQSQTADSSGVQSSVTNEVSLDEVKEALSLCAEELSLVRQLRDEVFARERSLATPRSVVDVITQALPPLAVLTSVRIARDGIEVRGRVKLIQSVAEMVEYLSAIDLFDAPRVQTFRQQTHDGSEGGDFVIVTTLKKNSL